MSRLERKFQLEEIYSEDAAHTTLSVDMDFEESLILSSIERGSFADEWVSKEIEMSSDYFEKELWSD
jgi:hypothetical protein